MDNAIAAVEEKLKKRQQIKEKKVSIHGCEVGTENLSQGSLYSILFDLSDTGL